MTYWLLSCAVFCAGASAIVTPSFSQTVTSSTYVFQGYPVDGAEPVGGMLVDRTNPNVLYGTTAQGGAFNAGEVYKLTGAPGSSLSKKTLYSFQADPDLGTPTGRLYQDASGALYGGCIAGGQPRINNGGIFKLTPPPGGQGEWIETILHTYSGETGQGTNFNVSGLVADKYGNLYGTVFLGRGRVFQIRPNGAYRDVYLFNGFPDGQGPSSPLTVGEDGVMYGVTEYGGTHSCLGYGCGAVYSLTPTGQNSLPLFTPVFGFDSGTGGHAPVGAVAIDPSGAIYGSNTLQKAYSGGTIFKVTLASHFQPTRQSVVYNFTGKTYPFNGVALDPTGNIYGTYAKGFSDFTQIFYLPPSAPGSYQNSTLVPLIGLLGSGFHTDGLTLTPNPATGFVTLDDIVVGGSKSRDANGTAFRLLVNPTALRNAGNSSRGHVDNVD